MRGKTSPRKWKINSVPRKQQTSTRRWSTLSIDTSRPKTGTASSLKEMEGNQLIMMKLTKFWAVGTSLPFKMSDKRTTGWSLMILWDLASYKLINDRWETIKAFQIRCIKYYPEQDPTSQPNCPPKQDHSLFTKEVIEYKSTYNKFVKNQCIVFNIWKVMRGNPLGRE